MTTQNKLKTHAPLWLYDPFDRDAGPYERFGEHTMFAFGCCDGYANPLLEWVANDNVASAELALAPNAPVMQVIEGGRNTLNDVTALRLRLVRNGYLPIPLYGKEPPVYGKNNERKGLAGWQKLEAVSRKQLDMWAKTWPDAVNTGGLTRPMPTIDIDIMQPDAAAALEELARKHFGERGRILVRFGLAPKRAIPLRTKTPFAKVVRYFVAPDGSTQKIEILGDGQQLALYGIHPDTQKPYRWHGGEPAEVGRSELPEVGQSDLEQYVAEAIKLLIEEFGFKLSDGKEKKEQASPAPSKEFNPYTMFVPVGDREKAWAETALHNVCEEMQDTKEGGRNKKLHSCGVRMGTMIARKWIERDVVESALMEAADDYINNDKSNPKGNGPRAAKSSIQSGIRYGLKHPHDDLSDTDAQVAVEGEDKSLPGGEPSNEKERIKPSKNEWHNAGLFDPWAQYYVPEFPLDVLPPRVQEFVVAQGEVLGCGASAMAMGALGTFSSALDHQFALKMMRHGNWYVSPRLWLLFFGDSSCLKTPLFDAATLPLETYQGEVQAHYRVDVKVAEANNCEKPPLPVRYVVWDTTIEKLGEMLARSPRGLLVKRDELSGWFGSMEQYGKGARAIRGFWLKAYDGGPGGVDRINRGEIFVDNLSVSLMGGIQPKLMAELGNLTADGLLPRFIPYLMKETEFALDRPCDTKHYNDLVRELLSTPTQVLSLSDPALEVMNALRRHLHILKRSTGGLADGFQAFVGKLPSMAGNLTLILHKIADPNRGGTIVGKATVEDVQRLVVDFILPHAMEFYRCTENATNGDRLRKIASYILTTSGKQRFVVSDLTSNVIDLRGLSVSEVNERVSPLVATDWVRPEGRGIENRSWSVNPNVHAQFAARAKEEEASKSALAKLMNSPRRDRA